MTYKGHVENGAIVLDQSGQLPEGASVTIEVAANEPTGRESDVSFAERYRDLIGTIDDMPDDWSENHDKYLRAEYGS